MSETANIPAPSTSESPSVVTQVIESSKPISSAKPYDGELLEAYEAESAKEESPVAKEETTPLEQKTEEGKTEEKSPEPARAKEGDKVEDGFEDVPIKRIINGKEVEFKVKDAVNAFLKQEEFNRNMDRRLSAVSQKEKAWEKETIDFRNKVSKLVEVAQQGDFVTAIRALAKVATADTGLDPVEFERQYFDQLEKVRKVYSELTPEQREAFFAKRALAEAKAKAEALESEKSELQQRTSLEQKVALVQKQHNLSQEEFWGNYKAMEELLVGEDKPFKSASEIQPEHVARYSLRVKHEEKVLEAAKKIGIDDDAILNQVSSVTASDPEITVEEIVGVIEKAGLGKVAKPIAVENLNRKAEKSKTRFSQASSTKKEEQKLEGLDTEDLEYLYRKQPKAYTRIVR